MEKPCSSYIGAARIVMYILHGSALQTLCNESSYIYLSGGPSIGYAWDRISCRLIEKSIIVSYFHWPVAYFIEYFHYLI